MSNIKSITAYNVNNAAYAPRTREAAALPFPNGSYNGYDTYNGIRTAKSSNPIAKGLENYIVANFPQFYLSRYTNKDSIIKALKNNPEIERILSAKGVEPKICMDNIQGKAAEHFLKTYEIAKAQSKGLPESQKMILLKAALLHDIGKAFIPEEIINKPGKLDPKEREIIDLHAQLGAEILKALDVETSVIEAIRLHHTPHYRPDNASNEVAEILSVSDVYSALDEDRPYKKRLDKNIIKNIMTHDDGLNQNLVKKLF